MTRFLLPPLGAMAVALPLLAQNPTPPAYSPFHLDGAAYRQEIRSVITITSGRERTRESSLRDGRLRLLAMGRDSVVLLEAWFDTLAVWREGAGGRLTPDTDGVIGGRFRGLLTRQGGFAATDVPFVPDALAQVAELARALADLLPPLPPVALLPGGSIRDDFGTAFLRVPDGVVDGRRVERHRLVRQGESEEVSCFPIPPKCGPTGRSARPGCSAGPRMWGWCAGNGR